MPAEFAEDAVERIRELTRHIRKADGRETIRDLNRRRERLLTAMGAHLHVRDDAPPVLVLSPDDWVDDGTVHPDRIDDRSRACEVPLDPEAEPATWEAVMEANMAVAEAVERRHGPDHGANAEALAAYLSNHHLRRIDAATEAELRTFLTEYYPRNVWPTSHQAAIVRASVERAREVAADCASASS